MAMLTKESFKYDPFLTRRMFLKASALKPHLHLSSLCVHLTISKFNYTTIERRSKKSNKVHADFICHSTL